MDVGKSLCAVACEDTHSQIFAISDHKECARPLVLYNANSTGNFCHSSNVFRQGRDEYCAPQAPTICRRNVWCFVCHREIFSVAMAFDRLNEHCCCTQGLELAAHLWFRFGRLVCVLNFVSAHN